MIKMTTVLRRKLAHKKTTNNSDSTKSLVVNKKTKKTFLNPHSDNTKITNTTPHDTTNNNSGSDLGGGGAYSDCPFFIIRNEDSVGDCRYELIYKNNLMCISAQNSLEDTLQSITNMTKRGGYSLGGLIDYIDNGIIDSEHNFSPCPSVKQFRKESMNSDYDEVIMDTIKKCAENKPIKSPRRKLVAKRG